MLSRLPPTLLVLIAICCVQAGGAAAKTLFPHLGPDGVVWLRVVLAAMFMLLLVRPDIAFWRALPRDRWRPLLGYALALGGMNWLFYHALARLPIGVAVTLEFIGPLGVALYHSRRAVDWLWVLLAAGGIVLLSPWGGVSDGLDGLGVIFALAAGGCWAAYIVLGQRVSQQIPAQQALLLAFGVVALLLAPIGLPAAAAVWRHPQWLLLAAAVALLSSLLPYLLELKALGRMPAQRFGILMSLEPAAAALAGWLVLSEALSATQMLALVLVAAASYGSARLGRQGG
ncbi:EamA family transporter [Chitinibacteraceae bacterium HSL-7]